MVSWLNIRSTAEQINHILKRSSENEKEFVVLSLIQTYFINIAAHWDKYGNDTKNRNLYKLKLLAKHNISFVVLFFNRVMHLTNSTLTNP